MSEILTLKSNTRLEVRPCLAHVARSVAERCNGCQDILGDADGFVRGDPDAVVARRRIERPGDITERRGSDREHRREARLDPCAACVVKKLNVVNAVRHDPRMMKVHRPHGGPIGKMRLRLIASKSGDLVERAA